ncbi:MAG: ATP synthase F1 subunit delta [Leptolyngbyaceae cyanobacterium SU_3_3]|nr:ATP synthase F1 subunit delta [Leptolyngbyaceae cyanobacterium SU_3_3]
MSVAQSQDLVDRFSEDMNGLLNLLESSEELSTLLASPIVKPDVQKSVLTQILGDQVHPLVRNFLMVLVERRRVLFLVGICKQFQALVRKLNQTVLLCSALASPTPDSAKICLGNT